VIGFHHAVTRGRVNSGRRIFQRLAFLLSARK
jgi:hypothetical protein